MYRKLIFAFQVHWHGRMTRPDGLRGKGERDKFKKKILRLFLKKFFVKKILKNFFQ